MFAYTYSNILSMKSLTTHIKESLSKSIVDIAVGNSSSKKEATDFDKKEEPAGSATSSS